MEIIEKTLVGRGLKTAWLDGGKRGANILCFLHGFPDDAKVWLPLMQHFASDFRVIAPMIRGAGKSVSCRGLHRFTPDAIALDVLQILRQVDPSAKKNIILVGHDLGGILAWHIARLIEDRLRALVIINSADLIQVWRRKSMPRQILKSWYVFIMWLPLIPNILWRVAPHLLANIGYTSGGLPQEFTAAKRNTAILHQSMKQYRAFALEFLRKRLWRQTAALKVPVLAIHGKKDAFLLPATLAEFAGLALNIQLRVIDGNHWLQLEQTKKIYQLIETFLKDHKVAA